MKHKIIFSVLSVAAVGVGIKILVDSKPAFLESKRTIAQAFQSCQAIEETAIDEKTPVEVAVEKTFTNVSQKVFKMHCQACHFGEDSTEPHLDDYASTMAFVDVKEPEQSRLLKALGRTGRIKMPPSFDLAKKDEAGLRLVREWVEAGAPE